MKSILFGLVNLCVFISVLGAGGGGHASSNSNGALGKLDSKNSQVIYKGDHFVHAGKPLNIVCTLSIFEPLKWTKNGVALEFEKNGYTLQDIPVSRGFVAQRLKVAKSDKSHAGNYKCTAFSPLSHSVYILSAHESVTTECKGFPSGSSDHCQNQKIVKWISDDSESTQLIHIGFPTSLKCKVGQEEGENPKLKWSKDGNVISANDERYQIFKENSTLLIKKAEKDDVGVYRCDDNDFIPPRTSSISVIHLNFKTLPKSVTVLQGDKFALNCDVVGEPTPTVAWFKDGASVQDVMNASRYSLEPNEGGIKGAVLSVAVSEYEDRADYTCAISILDAHYNTTTLVRVKDMYAALWPFLGICAEVILLCVIIFIYEKRRAKNDFEESDTDQPPEQQKPAGEQQDSVRCRK